MLSRASRIGALALALGAASSVRAQQELVLKCVNGAPELNATDPEMARATFDRLLWRTSFENYQTLQSTAGALAAFDSIVARGRELLVQSGNAQTLATERGLLETKLADARVNLISMLRSDGRFLREGAAVDAQSLKVSPNTNVAGHFRVGLNVDIDVSDNTRPVAMSICAVAVTASRFLEYMDEPALRQIASEYEHATRHWDMFLAQGYSMTLVERFAASCRLPYIGWLIDPVRNCSRDPGRSLEPPSQQWLFFHPTVGLAPVFRSDTSIRNLVIVEGYGYLHHFYGATKIRTIGLSVAGAQPEIGRARLGGVLHTPWLTGGVFWRKSERPLYVFSADVAGWIPGVRAAMRDVRYAGLAQRIVAGR